MVKRPNWQYPHKYLRQKIPAKIVILYTYTAERRDVCIELYIADDQKISRGPRHLGGGGDVHLNIKPNLRAVYGHHTLHKWGGNISSIHNVIEPSKYFVGPTWDKFSTRGGTPFPSSNLPKNGTFS